MAVTELTHVAMCSVVDERHRQEALVLAGKFEHTCSDPFAMTDDRRYVVLGEEFGEVAEALLEHDRGNLREELVQVAAVALAWIEGLDHENRIAATPLPA